MPERFDVRLRRDVLRPVTSPDRDDVVQALVDNHQRFLAFLERRVGSRETAEDILQDGFVRALERADTLRSEESATAWFYRLLRNALIDYYRRRGAEDRALAAVGDDWQSAEGDDELHEIVCACVRELIGTLKPEYGAALRRVELEGAKVVVFASEAGITVSNASVRLHRAREALRQRVLESCGTCVTHGCRSCECGQPQKRVAVNPLRGV